MTQEELDARLDALERDWPDSVDPIAGLVIFAGFTMFDFQL